MDTFDIFWDNIVAGKDEEREAEPVQADSSQIKHKISTFQLYTDECNNYKGLMLPEIIALLDGQNVYGIGAVLEKQPGKKATLPICAAAGTVVFSIDREPEGIYVNILWFYVGRDFRGKGVGTRLLEAIRESIKNSGAEFMKLTMPPSEECRELARFMAKEGFAFDVTSDAGTIISVEELQDALDDFAVRYTPKGKELSDFKYLEVREYMRKICQKYSWKDLGGLLGMKDSIFDPSVSTVYAENDSISNMILVQKKSDKLLSVEFVADPGNVENSDLLGVIIKAADAAERIYGPEAEISIRCRHTETAEFLSKILPNKVMKRVVCAACNI